MDNQDNSVSIEKRQVGIVKWFSNKLGYGFITYTDENNVSHDVFVHHTSIKPRRTSYRTFRFFDDRIFNKLPNKGIFPL